MKANKSTVVTALLFTSAVVFAQTDSTHSKKTRKGFQDAAYFGFSLGIISRGGLLNKL